MRKAVKAPTELTHDQFVRHVLEIAKLFGWTSAHFRPAQTSHGWVTPVQGDGKGFPDVVLAKPGRRTLWVEVKSTKDKLRPEQEMWRDVLLAAGEDWRLWYTTDFDTAAEILQRRGADAPTRRAGK
jgi:hypothetical protein